MQIIEIIAIYGEHLLIQLNQISTRFNSVFKHRMIIVYLLFTHRIQPHITHHIYIHSSTINSNLSFLHIINSKNYYNTLIFNNT